jgi:integrase
MGLLMARVSKRNWRTSGGEIRSGWVLTFVDHAGIRHRKSFPTKHSADVERIRIEGTLDQRVCATEGPTVGEAANAFLEDFADLVRQGRRERSTLYAYDQHVRLHISSRKIARIKLVHLTAPHCSMFAKELESELSDAMAIRVLRSLKTILRFSRTSGWLLTNPAESVNIRTFAHRRRQKVEIPSKKSLLRLLRAAQGFDLTKRAKAFVSLLLFGGLRMSELRGLRRPDIDIAGCRVTVAQRADRWQKIGVVKTTSAARTIPLPQSAIDAINIWMRRAPRSDRDLLFPNGAGNVETYQNLYKRFWLPLMQAAGLGNKIVKSGGREKFEPEFGMHALRHAAVSLWIEQGAKPKKVQQWAGHASVQFTMDVYGHLWDDTEGDARTAECAAKSIEGESNNC